MKKLLILSLLFLLVGCSGEYRSFNSINEAEQEIGDIKTPVMPDDYRIKEITYENDGFTHPVTKVFYQNGKDRITFMLASSWFDDSPSDKIDSDKISDIVWITKNKEFILKWRKSDKHSYKYLFTNREEDKSWFITIAKNYEEQGG